MTSIKVTPMLEQYLSIKQEVPEALLLFRMGDFYEFFLEDAVIASKELQITLTSRNPQKENRIEMCGVPWHSVDSYIATLVKRGYTVAICDQIENPKDAKGIVKRAITRIITPGTVIEEGVLEAKEYNFLSAMYFSEKTRQGALAWVDVSTGKWAGFSTSSYSQIQEWIHKIQTKELLIPDTMYVNKEDFSDIH
ncbi:MAG: DNA mismatch repair protein MutS, partial [Desulfovibrionaceae bacterium]|nr:DNA mismatch repair protein MutS [Desulfovibrionaceae bacterium]